VTRPAAQSGPPAQPESASVAQTAQRRFPIPAPQLWGTRPGRLGVFAVIASAVLGMLITIAAGAEPGIVLSVCLVLGTVAAALAVRRDAIYLIFPVPALSYSAAAVLAGLIHDRAMDTSRTALALNATQWIASGFVAMSVATALAVAIGGYRWWRSTRLPDSLAAGRRGRGR
jgi:hypothetical protein